MAGNHDGGIKTKNTIINKLGSQESYHEYMARIGSIGGKKGKDGGFASEKVGPDGMTGQERAKKYGAIGGKKSKRSRASDY